MILKVKYTKNTCWMSSILKSFKWLFTYDVYEDRIKGTLIIYFYSQESARFRMGLGWNSTNFSVKFRVTIYTV